MACCEIAGWKGQQAVVSDLPYYVSRDKAALSVDSSALVVSHSLD